MFTSNNNRTAPRTHRAAPVPSDDTQSALTSENYYLCELPQHLYGRSRRLLSLRHARQMLQCRCTHGTNPQLETGKSKAFNSATEARLGRCGLRKQASCREHTTEQQQGCPRTLPAPMPCSAVPAAGQSPGRPPSDGAPGVLTIIAREVLNGHVLDGDLLEEVGFLTARVARDDSFLPEPLAQPRQVAVTVERIGQEVSEHREGGRGEFRVSPPPSPNRTDPSPHSQPFPVPLQSPIHTQSRLMGCVFCVFFSQDIYV